MIFTHKYTNNRHENPVFKPLLACVTLYPPFTNNGCAHIFIKRNKFPAATKQNSQQKHLSI
jgi:hypothetical protein